MNDQSYIFVPEEIVAEILVRLHVKPLFRMKLLSKRWNSIISNPEFGQTYLQRVGSSPKSSSLWPLGGMLRAPPEDILPIRSRHSRNSVPTSSPSLYMPSFFTARIDKYSKFQILASSSGLILFRFYPRYSISSSYGFITDLCVSNPLTKKSVLLPPLVLSRALKRAVGFSTRSLIYKVVYILQESFSDSRNATIMVFSSNKGKWTTKNQITCPKVVFGVDGAASFCKGIMYWFNWDSRSIVTYDPYDNSDRFGHIQLLGGSGDILRKSSMNLIHLGQEDVLKYGDIECYSAKDTKLSVWRLADYEKGEWRLEKKCPISPLLSELLLSNGGSLVAPDPWDGYLFCVLVNKIDRVSAIDLTSAKEVFSKPHAGPIVGTTKFVPIALSPWSSPFNRQVRSNSSSIVRFRLVYNPVCLTLPGSIEIVVWLQ